MADRVDAERILQRARLPFDHRERTIRVSTDHMSPKVLDDLRRVGWQVQEVGPTHIVISPDIQQTWSGGSGGLIK